MTRALKYYDLHMFLYAFRSFPYCFKKILSTFCGFVTSMLSGAKKRKVSIEK